MQALDMRPIAQLDAACRQQRRQSACNVVHAALDLPAPGLLNMSDQHQRGRRAERR